MFNALLISLGIVFAFFAYIFVTAVMTFVIIWLGCDLICGKYYYWKKIGKFFVNLFYTILSILTCLCAYIIHVLKTATNLKAFF